MPKLSPAAIAVLDAGFSCIDRCNAIGAALRVAADQIMPERINPLGDEHDNARHAQWTRIRYKLLALADELENTDQSTTNHSHG
jgi:hypothetical protein